MNLSLTNDEANLVAYACRELAFRRAEQAMDGRRQGEDEFAEANEREAKAYYAIANKIFNLGLCTQSSLR